MYCHDSYAVSQLGVFPQTFRYLVGNCEAEEWDYCRRGRSALDAAFLCALSCEVSIRTGEHCGVLLWDFEKLFDIVHLPVLVANASSF